MSLWLLLTLPWVGVLAFLALGVRTPRRLGGEQATEAPFVSVIVPARNEASNIRTCLWSLTASRYPAFEVVVVDDGSEDGTGDIARSMESGAPRRMTVVGGLPLPDGWLGKPWACAQGARMARGDLLLFTDADTVHGPDLLDRAVAALDEDGADVLTVAGRQLMESFWERLVQPQIFLTLIMRFFDVEGAVREGRWRGAIANGQFLLFRRDVYEALGGHGAVRGEIVEDLALAQLLVRRGYRLAVRMAEGQLSTRMYRSLRQVVDGWSKNLLVGAQRTVAPWLRPLIAPGTAVAGLGLWITPPVLLATSLVGVGGRGPMVWSAVVVAVSVVFWGAFTHRMGAPAWCGLLYPLGAAVGLFILFRSWLRGRRVEWKGRAYVLDDPASGD
jgi:chlorobactene glucosyltransferase